LINYQNGASYQSKQLQIFTLGRFAVIKGEEVLTEASERSIKMWELLKYLIVHHNSVLMPENLTEQLWPEQAYIDAKSSLRSLVHRLRRLLGNDIELIRFSQGGYTLNRHQDLWLDLHIFEDSCTSARQAAKLGQSENAISLYKKALSCYKGDLMPECVHCDWLIPARNYYHRLYLQSTSELSQLLKRANLYSEIENEIGKALMIDNLDENIHILLIEALLAEGKISQAKAHYEKATAMFYTELGIKPSSAFKYVLRLIKAHEDTSNLSDLMLFREELETKNQAHGSFLCDPEFFRYYYQIESHRATRTGQNGLLVVFSIMADNGKKYPSNTRSSKMEMFKELLKNSLRNTDVICDFGNDQIMALLPLTTLEQGKQIINRIRNTSHGNEIIFKEDIHLLNQEI